MCGDPLLSTGQRGACRNCQGPSIGSLRRRGSGRGSQHSHQAADETCGNGALHLYRFLRDQDGEPETGRKVQPVGVLSHLRLPGERRSHPLFGLQGEIGHCLRRVSVGRELLFTPQREVLYREEGGARSGRESLSGFLERLRPQLPGGRVLVRKRDQRLDP